MADKTIILSKDPSQLCQEIPLIEGDNNTYVIRFVAPRYSGGVDLANLTWGVNIKNATLEQGFVNLSSATSDDSAVYIDWNVGAFATVLHGSSFCTIEGRNNSSSSYPVWKSSVVTLRVGRAISADDIIDGSNVDSITAIAENVAESIVGNSVRYDTSQSLNSTQKATARTNIDALAEEDLDDIVVVSEEEPQTEITQIWVNPDFEEIQVPSYAEYSELKSAVVNSSSVDVIPLCSIAQNGSKNGIDYTFSGSTCAVVGTSTASSFSNIYADLSALPVGIHAGDTIYAKVSTTDSNVRIAAVFYKQDGTYYPYNYIISDRVLSVPSDAVGFGFRVDVPNGKTVDATIRYALLTAPSNQELSGEIFDINSEITEIEPAVAALDETVGENLLLNSNAVSKPNHHGVTFIKNSDYSYTIRGTCVDNTAFIDLYSSVTEIPAWLEYNTQYYVQFSASNVSFMVYAVDSQGTPYNIYAGNWSGSFYIPSEYVGLIIRLSVSVGRTVDETVYPIISTTVPYKFITDNNTRLPSGVYGYRRRATTISNITQSNPKDVAPGTLIRVTGVSNNPNIVVCSKNLYRNPHGLDTYTVNNVTYTYNETDGTITATSTGATGTTVYPNYITTLNGIGFAGLFKFSLKSDAIVTFSDNASTEQFVYNNLYMQVSDGTNLYELHGHNLTMKCLANVEYGVRLYVGQGFSGTVVFKPQIELNGYSTDFEPFTGIYCDGEGNKIVINNLNGNTDAIMIPGNVATVISYDSSVSVTYMKQDRLDTAYDKVIKNKPSIAKKPLMLSFLDDDTVNLTYVELFHDTLADLGIIGNYAAITNHLAASSALQDKLLEYEAEGFGIVCHCSDQAGTATDYFRPYGDRDIDRARQNMITAVRYIREAGFISGDIWATPYGVNDSQMQELAKSLGFRGLISGLNYTPVFGNITSRYNIPRYSIGVSNDITKAGMDACVENGGWIIVTTHAYQWGNDVQTYKQKISEIIAYANSIGMEIVNIEDGFRTFFND